MNMKKYALLLAAALFVSAFSACDDETTLPYIPYEEDKTETPTEGEDPDIITNTYRLNQVLQCSPENPSGVDIFGKLDFFATLRMTVSVSATGAVVEFDNGDIPFLPFTEALPEGRMRPGPQRRSQRTPHPRHRHGHRHLREGRLHHRIPARQQAVELQVQIHETLIPADHEINA